MAEATVMSRVTVPLLCDAVSVRVCSPQ
ncbi:adaptor-related protein complex 2, sigma 1 subunit, isoform CRA_b [Rattus norvegicus]|uniref:Adaptor-related protein complex 2, sigma 1 subunit, isoform CRA_b n=1 Tax=Rattus norvegicus TaxID=10116 RepID=A6J8C3_RAT|nr:adaptor-related protein complex 2, sigma 1 subunit, isoform CRA_b [Rattus norvegicus]EDM08314.1 adaptor-related protein complex 2, sigma 1 subunit, isoform CRA_b [Rattus norvegicus]